VFGRWLLVSGPETRKACLVFRARCECGTEKIVYRSSLLSGKSQSCGCLRTEKVSKACTLHGMYSAPVYSVWRAMLQRCNNKKNQGYKNYGGRGVTVCPEWATLKSSIETWVTLLFLALC